MEVARCANPQTAVKKFFLTTWNVNEITRNERAADDAGVVTSTTVRGEQSPENQAEVMVENKLFFTCEDNLGFECRCNE